MQAVIAGLDSMSDDFLAVVQEAGADGKMPVVQGQFSDVVQALGDVILTPKNLKSEVLRCVDTLPREFTDLNGFRSGLSTAFESLSVDASKQWVGAV